MIDVRFLDLAHRRLVSGEIRREIPDIINLADINRMWFMIRPALLEFLQGPYPGPERIELVEHPKNQISVRPIARFGLRDRLIWDALGLEISSIVDGIIPGNIYSHRGNKPSSHSVHHWLRMREKARRILRNDDRVIMARTDVAAFYENVDHEIMAMDLLSAGVPQHTANTVHFFLERYQQQSRAWGLPQGSSTSGVLANIYLLPVDELIRQSGTVHVRYSDDMYLFDTGQDRLRATLLHANQAMRSRRLSMSGPKTEILDREESEKYLDDSLKDTISYMLGLGKPWARKMLRILFKEAILSKPPNERDIKFALPRFRKKRDEEALAWALEHLKDLHHLSDHLMRYCEAFRLKRKDLCTAIEDLLETVDLSSYPYLERNILQACLRGQISSPIIKEHAWRVLRDQNRTNLPREFAARYIGLHGSAADGPLLRLQYECEHQDSVHRAILVSLYEADYLPRGLLANLSKSRLDIRWTAEYLLRSPQIPMPS
ncbi:RNA-directed DNA polymerase [Kitasatospora purpeofusca]|uniref:RNA-directed DNA polymerase n=1 Tax=Kitasatospora purpeofusca TaxID=67352 RepID=UPI002E135CED|nr:RNA-directed DNA polymerase [Kitasatospora purpeofusca]